MRTAKRIDNLPPYLFAEIDRKKAIKTAQGIDVISLGIGAPATRATASTSGSATRRASNSRTKSS